MPANKVHFLVVCTSDNNFIVAAYVSMKVNKVVLIGYLYVPELKNKEWKVHGQMAKCFNKCLAYLEI